MATGILITVVLVFAVRGMFLGFAGVIGKTAGIIGGYLVAYHYRHPLAELIASHITISLPPAVIAAISGSILFISTMIVTGLAVAMICRAICATIPALNVILNKASWGSKCAGAINNGAIGLALALLGLWAFGLTTGNADHTDPVQANANRFGEAVFLIVSEHTDITLPKLPSSKLTPGTPKLSNRLTSLTEKIRSASPENSHDQSLAQGSAIIQSAADPGKRVSYYPQNNSTTSTSAEGYVLSLIDSKQIEQLTNNPELLDIARKSVGNNPEQLQKILSHPQLRKLLEFLQEDQNTEEKRQ